MRDGRRLAIGVSRHHALGMLLSGILACAWIAVGQARPALAADGISDTAAETYRLVPADGVLRVTIDLAVTNDVPSSSQAVPCTKWEYDPWVGYYPVQTTCNQPVAYSVSSSYVWLERNARNIVMTADRGDVTRSVEKRIDGFTAYRLDFEPVETGQTRTVRITYEVPGGKPRSATTTRVGRAYANFCVAANGLDGGSVRVVVPKAFSMDVWPEPMVTTPSGSTVAYDSGSIAETASFYRCFEGTNPAGFARSTVTSPSGRTVIVEGWPEDRAWRSAVADEVSVAVARLEAMVGRGLPGSGPIEIREVSDSELGDYAGTFDPEIGIARISETYSEPGVVAHELSHAWFNLDNFATRWMSEGLAQWAERVSPAAGPPCTAPGAYPGRGTPDLDEWAFVGPRSTDAERALVTYQYDAACWITTSLGTRMGDARMSDVIRAMLDRRAAYGDTTADRRPGSGSVDWKLFLDLVDEVGLVPAGVSDLTFAQDLLVHYGVADPVSLAGRAEARAAYHRLAAALGDWQMPDAIRAPLETWDFGAAQSRTATAEETLAAVRQADATLAGIDAADGPARVAFEGATDAAGLAGAAAIATSQASSAADVAGALAALDEPRDPLEEIGLWGAELQPVADRAVAAVKVADATAAIDAAGEIRDELDRASWVGMLRVAFGTGGGLVAVLLLALGIALLRRRRRPPTAVAADAWTNAAGAQGGDEVTRLPSSVGAGFDDAEPTRIVPPGGPPTGSGRP